MGSIFRPDIHYPPPSFGLTRRPPLLTLEIIACPASGVYGGYSGYPIPVNPARWAMAFMPFYALSTRTTRLYA